MRLYNNKPHPNFLLPLFYEDKITYYISPIGEKSEHIGLFTLDNGYLSKIFHGHHEKFIAATYYNKNHEKFLVACSKNIINVWNMESGVLCKTLRIHIGSFKKLNTCLIDGIIYIVAFSTKSVYTLWDTNNFNLYKQVVDFRADDSSTVCNVIYVGNTVQLINGISNHAFSLWDLNDEIKKIYIDDKIINIKSMQLCQIYYKNNQLYLIFISSENCFKIYCYSTGQLIKELQSDAKNIIDSHIFYRQNKIYFYAYSQYKMQLWNIDDETYFNFDVLKSQLSFQWGHLIKEHFIENGCIHYIFFNSDTFYIYNVEKNQLAYVLTANFSQQSMISCQTLLFQNEMYLIVLLSENSSDQVYLIHIFHLPSQALCYSISFIAKKIYYIEPIIHEKNFLIGIGCHRVINEFVVLNIQIDAHLNNEIITIPLKQNCIKKIVSTDFPKKNCVIFYDENFCIADLDTGIIFYDNLLNPEQTFAPISYCKLEKHNTENLIFFTQHQNLLLYDLASKQIVQTYHALNDIIYCTTINFESQYFLIYVDSEDILYLITPANFIIKKYRLLDYFLNLSFHNNTLFITFKNGLWITIDFQELLPHTHKTSTLSLKPLQISARDILKRQYFSTSINTRRFLLNTFEEPISNFFIYTQ